MKTKRKPAVLAWFILYVRGQENIWNAEELYAQLQGLDAEQAARVRRAMAEEQWHFMDEDEREQFLMTWLPMHTELHDLLADFRFGGYRVEPPDLRHRRRERRTEPQAADPRGDPEAAKFRVRDLPVSGAGGISDLRKH